MRIWPPCRLVQGWFSSHRASGSLCSYLRHWGLGFLSPAVGASQVLSCSSCVPLSHTCLGSCLHFWSYSLLGRQTFVAFEFQTPHIERPTGHLPWVFCLHLQLRVSSPGLPTSVHLLPCYMLSRRRPHHPQGPRQEQGFSLGGLSLPPPSVLLVPSSVFL